MRLIEIVLILLVLQGATCVCNGQPVSRQEAGRIIQEIAEVYRAPIALDIEYDVLANDDDGLRRILTIEEAFDAGRYFNRISHWYDQSLYEFSDSKYDPVLNSFYWSSSRIVQFNETQRECHEITPWIDPQLHLDTRRFLSSVGILTPNRLSGSLADVQEEGFAYNGRHFYPALFVYSDDPWTVERLSDSRVCVQQKVHGVTDRLMFEFRPFPVLVMRELVNSRRGLQMQFAFQDFVDVEGAWAIPQRIDIDFDDRPDLRMVMLELSTKVSSGRFAVPVLGGTRYFNSDRELTHVTAGGYDLLDLTAERMEMAMAARPVSAVSSGLLNVSVSLFAIVVLMWGVNWLGWRRKC
ncbi:lyase family protein [Crateriforma conspicua]|uniref:hypothetical protein n=1 Tax=Crateriforma conspicua TaxID=2527996 RepID=UPI0011A6F8E6|nr:hypothetical protein [Crateriforma conspicua]